MFRQIFKPSPVPVGFMLFVSSIILKGSKSLSKSFGWTPGPLSVTSTSNRRQVFVFNYVETVISIKPLFLGTNFLAFVNRFIKTCWMRSLSPIVLLKLTFLKSVLNVISNPYNEKLTISMHSFKLWIISIFWSNFEILPFSNIRWSCMSLRLMLANWRHF